MYLPSLIHTETFVFILVAIGHIFNQVIELQDAHMGNILRNCKTVYLQWLDNLDTHEDFVVTAYALQWLVYCF